MGEKISTDISASDDAWHHIGLTWSGKSGKYEAYKDGVLISQGGNVQQGKVRKLFAYIV